MPARFGDWSLLGHAEDPIVADPWAVDDRARRYANTASVIEEQVARLRGIGRGELIGKYADELEQKSKELADQLAQTHGRYSTVAAALQDWSPALGDALWESGQALQDAESAELDRRTAVAMWVEHAAPGAALTAAQVQHNESRRAAITAANAAAGAARQRLARALHALDDEAGRIAARIDSAMRDGLNDSWWDKHKEAILETVKTIVQLAKDIGMVLAIVALFVPGLQIVAIAALIAASVALAGDVVLASNGEASWSDVVWDVVGLVGAGGTLASIRVAARASAAETKGVRYAGESLGRIAKNEGASKSAISAMEAAGRGAAKDAIQGAVKSKSSIEMLLKRPGDFLRYGGDVKLADQMNRVKALGTYLTEHPGLRGPEAFTREVMGASKWENVLKIDTATKPIAAAHDLWNDSQSLAKDKANHAGSISWGRDGIESGKDVAIVSHDLYTLVRVVGR